MAQAVGREERRQFVEDHYRPEGWGLLVKQVQVWQRGCVAGWMAFVLAVLMIVVLVFRSGPFPYPIVYDPDGRIIWHGTAATTREERFIDVRLVDWVGFCREASSDETRFVRDRKSCAAMVYGKAAEKFSVYNQETTALYKDKQRRVLVQAHTDQAEIVRQGVDRVQITWPETWTPEFGYGSEIHKFQMTLIYAWYAQPPTWSLAQARLNPSRVYVTDYWLDEVRREGK